MFSYEERVKAVQLFLKYDCSYTATIRELGYPSISTLRKWYKEYLISGELHREQRRNAKYSEEQKQVAVNHYFEYGQCYARTIRILGYPDRKSLRKWCEKLAPKSRKIRKSAIKLTQEQKKDILKKFYQPQINRKNLAEDEGISRAALYQWKNMYLGKDFPLRMSSIDQEKQKELLLQEIEELQKQIHQLQIEKALLEGASKLLKKDKGINLLQLTNQEKTILIDALRNQFQLKELLQQLHLAKSSYFYQKRRLEQPDKYFKERQLIISIFNNNFCVYGYRRIHQTLKNLGKTLSEKIVRRIMVEENLIVQFSKYKKYSSYAGEITPAHPNLLNRNFKATKPNEKWLTDITEFKIPAGKVYLSPLIDCYDGAVISWSIGTKPDAELVNSMLDNGINILQKNETPIIHTDRGAHYRWPDWIKRINKAKLIQSMSRKGYSPDNAACEGFFGRLKNEMFYQRNWKNVTINQFIEQLNTYIHWYNCQRIKLSLGGLSPLQYREKQKLIC
ncbi:IS3 family transposase [Enterococcus faecalis]|uniref:IS3 family transposase n=1 Tax=Enterococcus faecalis TaxID=1351 RepID=UPI003CC6C4F7